METATSSKWMIRIGYALSALFVLFMVFDGTIKVMQLPVVLTTFDQMGWPRDLSLSIGILELALTLFYVIPRTSIFAAVVLTGYLGGAIASHVRINDPLFTHVLFGIYLAAMMWGGIYLRDGPLRALIPLTK